MIAALFKRTLGWLPAAIVLAVVLVAGTRLIVLSMQQHAERARVGAQGEASQVAASIERQLQAVTQDASRQATRALATTGGSGSLAQVAPLGNGFWLGADGTALPSKSAPAAIANSIASEWASVTAQGDPPKPSVLG